MHSTKLVVLLAAAVSAADNQLFFNLNDPLFSISTLTLKGSNSAAATYDITCTNAPSSATGSAGSKPSNIELTPMPKPTGNARRADSSDSAVPSCLPYTIVQGKEVFEFHMTDPRPGLWTMDQKCSWKGEMTKADMTCSMSAGGEIAKSLHGDLVQSSVPLAQKDISLDNPTPYVTAVIVTATGGASGSASPTPSGGASGSGSAKGSASGSGSGSGASSVTGSAKPTASAPAASGAPAQGSGAFAVVGPMAFVAGAAGILAAALVL